MSPYASVLPLTIWVGTLIVCVLCVYVAWRSLFGDRGRGKRRCPKCWYDLSYSPGMTCGECGHTGRDERDFTRSRRRPMVALAAVFICAALVIGVNDQMNQRGMLRHVPTGLLIWSLPATGGMDGSIGREIERRASSVKLTPSQWQTLIERCAAGDWFASPPSDSWIDNYGRFISVSRNRFIRDAKMEAPLLTIPPLVQATTRETWPQGVPVVVAVRLEDWWPAGMECRVRATPRLSKGAASGPSAVAPLTFFRGAETRFRPSPFAMYLPPMDAGDHQITIDFQIDRRRAAAFSASARVAGDEPEEDAWEHVGTFTSMLATRIEGRLADMARPMSSEALNAQMAMVFGNTVRWAGGGRSPVRFGINAPATFGTEFNDVAVGVSVQLERHGTIARRLNLWWIGGDNIDQQGRNYGFEINFENLNLLRQLEDGSLDQDGWQLRVIGDPMLALRAGAAKNYWQGEIIVPISLRTSQTVAPPRMWWTEGDAIEETGSEGVE